MSAVIRGRTRVLKKIAYFHKCSGKFEEFLSHLTMLTSIGTAGIVVDFGEKKHLKKHPSKGKKAHF